MTTVRVYTSPNCSQCVLTKNLLTRDGVRFIEEDATDPQNIAALKELGFLAAPVVASGNSPAEMWSGFQPERIKALAHRINQKETP